MNREKSVKPVKTSYSALYVNNSKKNERIDLRKKLEIAERDLEKQKEEELKLTQEIVSYKTLINEYQQTLEEMTAVCDMKTAENKTLESERSKLTIESQNSHSQIQKLEEEYIQKIQRMSETQALEVNEVRKACDAELETLKLILQEDAPEELEEAGKKIKVLTMEVAHLSENLSIEKRFRAIEQRENNQLIHNLVKQNENLCDKIQPKKLTLSTETQTLQEKRDSVEDSNEYKKQIEKLNSKIRYLKRNNDSSMRKEIECIRKDSEQLKELYDDVESEKTVLLERFEHLKEECKEHRKSIMTKYHKTLQENQLLVQKNKELSENVVSHLSGEIINQILKLKNKDNLDSPLENLSEKDKLIIENKILKFQQSINSKSGMKPDLSYLREELYKEIETMVTRYDMLISLSNRTHETILNEKLETDTQLIDMKKQLVMDNAIITELKDTIREAESVKKSLQDDLNQLITKSKKQNEMINRVNGENNELMAQVNKLSFNMQSLESQIASLFAVKEENMRIKEKLNELKNSAADANMVIMKYKSETDKATSLEKELSHACAEIRSLHEVADLLKEKFSISEETIRQLQSDLLASNEGKIKLRQQVTSMDSRMTEICMANEVWRLELLRNRNLVESCDQKTRLYLRDDNYVTGWNTPKTHHSAGGDELIFKELPRE